jgi:hypothetical protein
LRGLEHRQKICLANYYNSVIMRGTYETNIPFLWNWPAMVRPVNCMCVFDISCG